MGIEHVNGILTKIVVMPTISIGTRPVIAQQMAIPIIVDLVKHPRVDRIVVATLVRRPSWIPRPGVVKRAVEPPFRVALAWLGCTATTS